MRLRSHRQEWETTGRDGGVQSPLPPGAYVLGPHWAWAEPPGVWSKRLGQSVGHPCQTQRLSSDVATSGTTQKVSALW